MMQSIIAVDWGTSSLRAMRVAGDGAVEARRESPQGIMNVPGGDFPAALRALIAGWEAAPVYAAGMVGSRQGWRETPYLPCPASLDDIARNLTEVAPDVFIAPGVMRDPPGEVPDVMRGEETQALGTGIGDGVVVLPGTHSKWVRLERGRIVSFATFMTGEVFAVLAAHSILGRLMEGEAGDDDAFARGYRRGAAAGSALLHELFGVRSLGLFGAVPPTGLRDYLSGMLIGTEIAGAARLLGEAPLAIVGAPALAARYQRALALAGHASTPLDAEAATARGLVAIARRR
jgi:2-dehydro-3-deoxygalactonokinase